MKELPDWERVLTAAAHLQTIILDTVPVGGTAVALHAGHRLSADGVTGQGVGQPCNLAKLVTVE